MTTLVSPMHISEDPDVPLLMTVISEPTDNPMSVKRCCINLPQRNETTWTLAPESRRARGKLDHILSRALFTSS
jgi:hypothetical protein